MVHTGDPQGIKPWHPLETNDSILYTTRSRFVNKYSKKMETRERRKVVADLNGSSKGMANMKSSSDIWRGKHLQRKEIKVHNKIVYNPIKLQRWWWWKKERLAYNGERGFGAVSISYKISRLFPPGIPSLFSVLIERKKERKQLPLRNHQGA